MHFIAFGFVLLFSIASAILNYWQFFLFKKTPLMPKNTEEYIETNETTTKIVEKPQVVFPNYSSVQDTIFLKKDTLTSRRFCDLFLVLHELGHANFTRTVHIEKYLERILQPFIMLARFLIMPYFLFAALLIAFRPDTERVFWIHLAILILFFIASVYRGYIVLVQEYNASSYALRKVKNSENLRYAKKIAIVNYLLQLSYFFLAISFMLIYLGVYYS